MIIQNSNVRVIIAGRVVPNISKFSLEHDYKETLPKATITYTDKKEKEEVQVLGVDQVKEDHLNKNKESTVWLQYICKRV